MPETNVIKIVEMALEKMNKDYCTLSKSYRTSEGIQQLTKSNKYLERPFAYEFYHALRTLIDTGEVDFGGCIVQAEVDKRYQQYFEDGKIPDFIIHVPDNDRNLAVFEFKLASNIGELRRDFDKLALFKKDRDLRYWHGIEVIIGDDEEVEYAIERATELSKPIGETIILIAFSTDSWQSKDYLIKY